MARRLTASDTRRQTIRDREFGEDSWDRAWRAADEKAGFAIVPRTLPILLELARQDNVVGKHDCGRVYTELFCRNWGQGIVEIYDEEGHALRAGYLSPRGLRTWRELMRALERAGFIEIRPKAARDVGYVLLVHPDRVFARFRAAGQMDDTLWRAYQEICDEFGVERLSDPNGRGPQALASGAASSVGG